MQAKSLDYIFVTNTYGILCAHINACKTGRADMNHCTHVLCVHMEMHMKQCVGNVNHCTEGNAKVHGIVCAHATECEFGDSVHVLLSVYVYVRTHVLYICEYACGCAHVTVFGVCIYEPLRHNFSGSFLSREFSLLPRNDSD